MAKKKEKKKVIKKAGVPKQTSTGYDAKDIYVLEGLEPVRRRPGMYIGSTGVDGLHHLIWEVVDNSLDEAMAGYCTQIGINLLPNDKISVIDNGRGIPVDIHPQTKKSALETVMTTLHAGGKFGGQSYKIAGGLHGVGVSVVCALSKWMRVEVCRGGNIYAQEYSQGKPKTKVTKIGKCEGSGTSVSFEPDPEVFTTTKKFIWTTILDHLRQQAYLTRGVKIIVFDGPRTHTFYFEGGLTSYVKYLNRSQKVLHNNIFYSEREKQGILVEIALQYTDDIQPLEVSFANNIHTGEGGMHLTGFRTALTRALNDYARKNGFIKGEEANLSGDDVREGLTAVVSVKLREPQFEGQTKAKLGNPEARTIVEAVFADAFEEWLEKNPNDARQIIEKCTLAQKARKAAKAARDTVIRKGILDGMTLPGKLADCSSREPEDSELFIVEGDSAGGCFSGETKVALLDGRSINFKQLIREHKRGKKNYCYTIEEDGTIGVGLIENPRKTKQNVPVIKVLLNNDEEIICTPNHKFMLRNGNYKIAKDLTSSDSLMPLYKKYSKKEGRITIEGYEMVLDPKLRKWIFTHLLSDKYNLKNGFYLEKQGSHKHHIDFNKLNNNPDNIECINKDQHLKLHRELLKFTLHREDVKEKIKELHRSPEFREKIKKAMSSPEMKKILSQRAKKQWANKEYKQYMLNKFLEFYENSPNYRKRNNELLNKVQREYWAKEDNRTEQAERVKKYFASHPEKRKELSLMAKKQWQDPGLMSWRSQKTREQWTDDFRTQRKFSYNKTYLQKALSTLKKIYERTGEINEMAYNKLRRDTADRSIIKLTTICDRFFNGDAKKLEEAVEKYNHKIREIIKLEKKIDVYDLEVAENHNFALASGIFVHNSAKQGRDRRFQAILPLRGKILNIERTRLDKILASKEVKALIIALGTAIAEEFDISKLRYHKVVIMTDADVDGAHIRTLLLTLFFRYFPQIIENGHLYIAQPPLYKISKGKDFVYVYSDEEKEKTINRMDKEKGGGINVQRYKGLGEMNPISLWETTMDPAKRTMKKVAVADAEEADRIFDILMGSEVLPRKKFIQTHAKNVRNLDI